ncbi:HNH endonuclease [Actinomadura sp. NBRC 104425]|uniref:HNH endonuclease n=1 Tax=Actinomadura sp. NBRC 104425 TaxID=3032204 RepID=UPI0024A46A32|nr:HNH endonuclease [Actinomadura sp. NBRC 104425]GLZ13526.1 HNH endonuclease [Actinomadura sp. NBRC 104425]
MIPLARPPLDDELAEALERRTDTLVRVRADVSRARKEWNAARPERGRLREILAGMAPGIERCMYCGDSLGTSIDHFEPLKEAPLRTFDWLNHLLACSMCNSNQKRDLFPRAADGTALLIDPSRDDPYDHLRLVLNTGRYRARDRRGEATIEVFGLNRGDLVMGRQHAVPRTEAMVMARRAALDAGDHRRAERLMNSLLHHPFIDVLYAMVRAAASPGAAKVMEPEVVPLLADPVFQGMMPGSRRS